MTKIVACRGCGKVHFSVDLATAEREIAVFNRFYDQLTPAGKQEFSPLSIAQFKACRGCGVSTVFAPVAWEDVPIDEPIPAVLDSLWT